ncbi:MAG: transcription antitermination factor NusB [Coriobacteriales bacterium]|jgi:N utilization substance protein B|nr:transcription antitermination factor NusB [Coriobacteriales bacterium]
MHTTKEASRTKGVHYDRTLARRKAVQLLYQAQIRGQSLPEVLDTSSFIEEIGVLPPYARVLIQGLDKHLDEVDSCLASSSNNWALDRMPLVDRCILRLAVYEMRFEDSVPVGVSINEAIELAREFGGEDGSGSFVNGVLGNIARGSTTRGESAPPERARGGGTQGGGRQGSNAHAAAAPARQQANTE